MRFIIFIAMAAILISTVKASNLSATERKLDLSINLDSDRNSSYIIIDSLNSYKVKNKTELSIPVFIYRGITLKRTVYVWMQDSQGKKISSKAKFSLPTRFQSYNFTANISFSGCNPDKTYIIVAEGLGINSRQEVQMFFEDCDTEDIISKTTSDKISFEVIDPCKEIYSGVQFSTRILLHNPTQDNLEVVAWSYVYRSSKTISGDREQNRKVVNLPSFSNVSFDLANTAIAQEGNYSLKIKLLRSDRKSPKEFTFPLRLKTENIQGGDNNIEITVKNKLNDSTKYNSIVTKRTLTKSNISGNRSGVIFQSSSAKARNMTVYFLIAVLVLVLVALVFKRL